MTKSHVPTVSRSQCPTVLRSQGPTVLQSYGPIVLWSLFLLSAPAAQLTWDVNVQRPSSYTLNLYRGESVDLVPRFISGTTPIALNAGATVELRYIPSTGWTNETYYAVTGSLYSATNGQASVPWTSAAAATNDTYTFTLAVIEPAGPILRCNGTITMIETVGWDSTGTPVTVSNVTRDEYLATNLYAAAQNLATSNAIATRDTVVSNAVTAAFGAADTVVSNAVTAAFGAADTVVSNAVTAAFGAADTVVSNAVTAAFGAADTVVSNAVTAAFGAADTVVSNAVTAWATPQKSTNDTPTLFSPRFIGDALVIYSTTNRAYTAFGTTTNDWQ